MGARAMLFGRSRRQQHAADDDQAHHRQHPETGREVPSAVGRRGAVLAPAPRHHSIVGRRRWATRCLQQHPERLVYEDSTAPRSRWPGWCEHRRCRGLSHRSFVLARAGYDGLDDRPDTGQQRLLPSLAGASASVNAWRSPHPPRTAATCGSAWSPSRSTQHQVSSAPTALRRLGPQTVAVYGSHIARNTNAARPHRGRRMPQPCGPAALITSRLISHQPSSPSANGRAGASTAPATEIRDVHPRDHLREMPAEIGSCGHPGNSAEDSVGVNRRRR